MVVDPLGDARHRDRAAERRRRWRASRPPPASRSTPARIVDLTLAGAHYDVMKAALDVLTTAPEFDLVRGGGRLLGALPSRARGQADHRQRRRAQSRSRRSWCPRRPRRWRGLPRPACRASTRRRPAPTRSRRRCARRAPRPIEVAVARSVRQRPHARRARSLCAARPARRAARAGGRARCDDHAGARPALSPIRSRSRRCRPRSRTRPMPAASCSNVRDGDALLAAIRTMRGPCRAHRHTPDRVLVAADDRRASAKC